MARRSDLGDDRSLANKVWRLDELNDEYQNFIDDCQRVGKNSKSQIKDEEVRGLWLIYKDLVLKDPHLPKELLLEEWLGEKARREFVRLSRKLI